MTKKQQEVVDLAEKLKDLATEAGIIISIELNVPNKKKLKKKKVKTNKVCGTANCEYAPDRTTEQIPSICSDCLTKLSSKNQKKYRNPNGMIKDILKELLK